MLHSLHLDDIVFEERNKTYGAYELRKTYDRNINTAIAIAIALFLLLVALPTLIKLLNGVETVAKAVPATGKPIILPPPPPIDKTVTPPPPVSIPPPVKIIKLLPPTVTEEEVPTEEEMPPMEVVRASNTGNETTEGADIVFEAPPQQQIIEEAPEEKAYLHVEQMPEFPGGTEELMKFLGKQTRYPSLALKMGVEGSVFVGFIISKRGSIEEVTVVKGLSKECDEEAMRVIKAMPDWRPGKQNGRAVAVKYVLPIRFRIDQ